MEVASNVVIISYFQVWRSRGALEMVNKRLKVSGRAFSSATKPHEEALPTKQNLLSAISSVLPGLGVIRQSTSHWGVPHSTTRHCNSQLGGCQHVLRHPCTNMFIAVIFQSFYAKLSSFISGVIHSNTQCTWGRTVIRFQVPCCNIF